MEVPTSIEIIRCSSQAIENALIIQISREMAKIQIDAAWWDKLEDSIQDPQNEPDKHWEWRALTSKTQNNHNFQTVGIETIDGTIQAAMLFRVDGVSVLEHGERTVFIERLATAPWNRDHLVARPCFRGAGGGLLIYAVAVSYSLGFLGRVNLVVTANEEFYTKRGFVLASNVGDEEVFELPASSAHAILESKGLIDG